MDKYKLILAAAIAFSTATAAAQAAWDVTFDNDSWPSGGSDKLSATSD